MNYISMSQKELNKYEVIKRSIRREITVEKAAELLGLSERQIYRLKAQVKEKGPLGVIHGNRGKPSNRKIPEKERQQIINLLHRYYSDFHPTHASEKLEEIHGFKRDPKTIRQIMINEGLWEPKKRKRVKYRCFRPRKEHFGEMVQFDGSYEYWFEERGPKCCLLAAIDDATNRITGAQFVWNEGVLSVFSFWQEYFLTHGKPRAIYLDKLRTYYNNILPERDEEMLTQVQRAMKEMGVQLIVAHSPQAKGRIENLFKTLQNRLIKELRLKNISDIKTANQFLKEEFIPWFNQKYSKKPVRKANLHRKLNRQEKEQLGAILSRQSQRVVQNDFTIRFNNKWYQLLKKQPATVFPKDQVIIEERIEGSLKIRLRGKYLNYQVLSAKPVKQAKKPWVIPASGKPIKKPYKPPKDHPWRKPFIIKKPDISISLKP